MDIFRLWLVEGLERRRIEGNMAKLRMRQAVALAREDAMAEDRSGILMGVDLTAVALYQLVTEAAKMCYLSRGRMVPPLAVAGSN